MEHVPSYYVAREAKGFARVFPSARFHGRFHVGFNAWRAQSLLSGNRSGRLHHPSTGERHMTIQTNTAKNGDVTVTTSKT